MKRREFLKGVTGLAVMPLLPASVIIMPTKLPIVMTVPQWESWLFSRRYSPDKDAATKTVDLICKYNQMSKDAVTTGRGVMCIDPGDMFT